MCFCGTSVLEGTITRNTSPKTKDGFTIFLYYRNSGNHSLLWFTSRGSVRRKVLNVLLKDNASLYSFILICSVGNLCYNNLSDKSVLINKVF